jgi:hypothetical protein
MRSRVASVALILCMTGCGCAGSPEKRSEPAGPASAAEHGRREVWGASFVLSDEWTGGANDAGGYEFTNGDVALLVGRHPLSPDATLESFMADRERSLRDFGVTVVAPRTDQVVGNARVLSSGGRAREDGGGVELLLLVARLSPSEGLSLMMVEDGAHAARLDAAWGRLLGTLRLP